MVKVDAGGGRCNPRENFVLCANCAPVIAGEFRRIAILVCEIELISGLNRSLAAYTEVFSPFFFGFTSQQVRRMGAPVISSQPHR